MGVVIGGDDMTQLPGNGGVVRKHLSMALEEALSAKEDGAQPVGAIIADDGGELLSRGRNRVLVSGDITAHAEIDALRQAGFGLLKGPPVADLTLFVTAEPCFMCLGGIMMSPISHVVWALNSPVGSPFDIVTGSGYLPKRMAELTATREPIPEIRENSRELLIEYYLVHDPRRAELLKQGRHPRGA
jgi:tRNA(adenine34) deaminase